MGFRLKLASEPDIVNPICMAWDHRGRLWGGRDDSNDDPDRQEFHQDSGRHQRDGRCDVVKVFAEGLNVPTSIVFANGGVIVAHVQIFSSRTPTGTTWLTRSSPQYRLGY